MATENGVQTIRSLLRSSVAESSYGYVATGIGIPKATLWRFLRDGYEPRKPSIRKALGLPVDPIVLAEARVCACGCRTSFVPIVPHQVRIPGHPRRRVATQIER